MPSPRVSALLLFASLAVFGCSSSSSLYEWGDYDQWLYENYKSPESDAKLYEDLTVLITEYESEGDSDAKPLAPGVYAEYGFLLMRRGENARAIHYYEKEKAQWPESALFMDRMIQVARIPEGSPQP